MCENGLGSLVGSSPFVVQRRARVVPCCVQKRWCKSIDGCYQRFSNLDPKLRLTEKVIEILGCISVRVGYHDHRPIRERVESRDRAHQIRDFKRERGNGKHVGDHHLNNQIVPSFLLRFRASPGGVRLVRSFASLSRSRLWMRVPRAAMRRRSCARRISRSYFENRIHVGTACDR